MEIHIEIDYNWSCDQNIEIPKAHEETLKEDALNRIFEMVKEGHSSGELYANVRFGKDVVPEEDEEAGLTYSGWWCFESD